MQTRRRTDAIARQLTHARRVLAAKRQRLQERRAQLDAAAMPGGTFAEGMELGKEHRKAFPEAAFHCRDVLGRLVTRRHQLVVSAFAHFRLEPKVRSVAAPCSACLCGCALHAVA